MADHSLTDLETPSGYETHDTYFATRYQQGGRDIYSIDLSLPQLVQTIPRPDPDRPLEGNRQISVSRARSFGEYLRDNTNAVYPPLLVQAPSGEFDFDVQLEVGGTQSGTSRFHGCHAASCVSSTASTGVSALTCAGSHSKKTSARPASRSRWPDALANETSSPITSTS